MRMQPLKLPRPTPTCWLPEEGNENEPAIKALVAALTSQTVKDYIDSTYDGAVVAVF